MIPRRGAIKPAVQGGGEVNKEIANEYKVRICSLSTLAVGFSFLHFDEKIN